MQQPSPGDPPADAQERRVPRRSLVAGAMAATAAGTLSGRLSPVMHRVCRRGRGLAAVVVAVFALAGSAPASANTVTEWTGHMSEAVFGVAREPGPAGGLSAAMVQGAMYDAVNAIERTHEPFLVAPPAKRWFSQDAAAATAAFRVLAHLFPAQVPSLQPRYDASLAAIGDGPAKAGGVRVGAAAAAAMIAARENDGRNGPFTFTGGTEPGVWRPTPPSFGLDPSAWVAEVRPFVIPSAERLRSDGPNALTSSEYAREFAEVKSDGSASSTTRTPDQTDAALFWHLGAQPWGTIFQGIIASQGLDNADSARLLAMARLASADSAIACWKDKYHWTFWRPITAIREADTDKNVDTEADPDWTPLLFTSDTDFPEHPSGHSCASGAFVSVLQDFFGTDRMAFSGFSVLSGTTRTYTRFSQALTEVVNARVWGGIHFRTGDEQGVTIGQKVARYQRRHCFRPVRRWTPKRGFQRRGPLPGCALTG